MRHRVAPGGGGSQASFLAARARRGLNTAIDDTPTQGIPPKDLALGLAGAAIGGALGYFLFIWIVRQGFYAVALPGLLLGLFCAGFSGRSSRGLGITCGVLALLLGLFTEWKVFPFSKDGSLTFFLTHLHALKPVTWIMILLGAAMGYYFGRGREGGGWFGKKTR